MHSFLANSQSLPFLESSEIFSMLGDLDLELEPFTLTCLDHCGTLVFSFLSPVSPPSSTTVDPVQPNGQPYPQTRSIAKSPPASPTTNLLYNNAIPLSAAYGESEDEHLRPTDVSRENIRPVVSRSRYSNSHNNAKSVA